MVYLDFVLVSIDKNPEFERLSHAKLISAQYFPRARAIISCAERAEPGQTFDQQRQDWFELVAPKCG
jgi:hypothetical protein